jgi:hypothetical protein
LRLEFTRRSDRKILQNGAESLSVHSWTLYHSALEHVVH